MVDDQDIALRIRGALVAVIEEYDTVHVEVESGVVYLEGVASSPVLRSRIERLAAQAPGVKRVINCLALEHVARLNAGYSSRSGPLWWQQLLDQRAIFSSTKRR